MPVTYALQHDWTGNSGCRYSEVSLFKVVNGTVFITDVTLDHDGFVIKESHTKSYQIDSARRSYKRCLEDGYRLLSGTPRFKRRHHYC